MNFKCLFLFKRTEIAIKAREEKEKGEKRQERILDEDYTGTADRERGEIRKEEG